MSRREGQERRANASKYSDPFNAKDAIDAKETQAPNLPDKCESKINISNETGLCREQMWEGGGCLLLAWDVWSLTHCGT